MPDTVRNMHTPTVPELLRWLQTHDSFSYMGPLDLYPTRVYVVSKIRTWANPNRFAVTIKAPLLRFRIDEGHLDRIYLPGEPMTKQFALPDTLPTPYFTIDAGATATVTVKTSQTEAGRMMVELWRDGVILCRVFAASVCGP